MKKHKTQVEGLEVEIIKFNPLKGGLVLGSTMKMFAPAIKEIAKAIGDDVDDQKQIDILMGAVGDLFTAYTPEEVMAYISELLTTGYVIVAGKKLSHLDDLESLSGEDGDALYLTSMIAVESIKYNFAKFLGKLMPDPASS